MVWKKKENNIERSCKSKISFESTRNLLKSPQKRFENKGSEWCNKHKRFRQTTRKWFSVKALKCYAVIYTYDSKNGLTEKEDSHTERRWKIITKENVVKPDKTQGNVKFVQKQTFVYNAKSRLSTLLASQSRKRKYTKRSICCSSEPNSKKHAYRRIYVTDIYAQLIKSVSHYRSARPKDKRQLVLRKNLPTTQSSLHHHEIAFRKYS